MPSLAGSPAAATALTPLPRASAVRATAAPRLEDHCGCGLIREGGPGAAYNEAAFHYFLAVERLRARRAQRPIHLLTVELGVRPDTDGRAETSVVRPVFVGLSSCLRATDFFGWYEHGRVVGAVLADFHPDSASEIDRFTARVDAVLRQRLTPDAASRLRVYLQQCDSDFTQSALPTRGDRTAEMV